MKLPTELIVMGQKVEVEYVDDLNSDDTGLYGECDYQNNKIRICSKKHKTEKDVISTMSHELVHFVLAKCGMSELLGENEESVVICLEENLLPLFNINRRKWRKKKEVQIGSQD